MNAIKTSWARKVLNADGQKVWQVDGICRNSKGQVITERVTQFLDEYGINKISIELAMEMWAKFHEESPEEVMGNGRI